MKIKFFCFISFLMMVDFANGQNQPRIESLIIKLKSAKDDTNKVNLLNDLSECYAEFQIQKKYIFQSLQLAEKLNFYTGEIIALKNLGNFSYDSSSFCFNKAKRLCLKTNNLFLLANILRDFNNSELSDSGQKVFKINNLIYSCQLFKKLNNEKEIYTNYLILAQCYARLNKKDSAYFYIKQMIALAEKSKDKTLLFPAYFNFAPIRHWVGDTTLVTEYFRKAELLLNIIEKTEPPRYDWLIQAGRFYYYLYVFYYDKNKPDSVIKYAKKALAYTLKTKKIKTFDYQYYYINSRIYNGLIRIYLNKNQLHNADEYVQIAISDFKSPLNRLQLFKLYFELSKIFSEYHVFDRSLFYNKEAMKIAEKMGDEKFKNLMYEIMAFHYRRLGDQHGNINNILQILKIKDPKNNPGGACRFYLKLAYSYARLGNSDSAKFYNDSAYNLNKKLGDIGYKGDLLINYTLIYELRKEYKKAFDYNQEAFDLKNKYNLDFDLDFAPEGNFARIYLNMNQYQKALYYSLKSLQISNSNNDKEGQRDDYKTLYEIYKNLNEPAKSLECYEKYNNLKEEISGENSRRAFQIAKMNELSEKSDHEIKTLQQKEQFKELKIQFQKRIVYSLLLGSLLLIGLLAFAFYNYVQKKNAYQILEQQKEEIETQSEEITSQRDMLFQQNKDITDSMEYAKFIQEALLTSHEVLDNCKLRNFILYKPRDIISGDFYWFKQIKNYLYFTAADCTGHGVPGAFMSVLGISLLNEIVGKRDLNPPAMVLNELRKRLKKSLKQDNPDTSSHDGMDITLCLLDLETNQLQYSGAFNPLLLIRNNELTEYEADRMPVGVHPKDSNNFTNHEIQLQKSDSLYLFSDGYVSQFGGPEGKKFNMKQFKQLLLAAQAEPIENQNQILDSRFIEWQGSIGQVDDVLVIGVKV
jgi:serine phosphatase RsbU (regulator of sigma subunit)